VKIKYAPSKEKIEKLVKKHLEKIKGKIDLKLAIIFGSYAKNTYTWGSDIDLLLIAEKLPKRPLERSQTLTDPNFPIQIQPLAYTPQEFQKMIKENHPLINEVVNNGKIIYTTPKYKRILQLSASHNENCKFPKRKRNPQRKAT